MAAKKGLGKGLDALFTGQAPDMQLSGDETVVELKLMEVEPNRNQPRTDFDADKLSDLANSIAEHGVIQPIIVHRLETGFYQIIAGERRWRASKLAGKKTIPAIIRTTDNQRVYELALIENLQRQDLNPIEEALGYKKLMDDFSLTQEQISKKLSKSRSSVANSLRLLNLPKDVIQLISTKQLSFGHAKVLLSCESAKRQSELAKLVVEQGLSVRDLETLVQAAPKKQKQKKEEDTNVKVALLALEKQLAGTFGTKVKIVNGKSRGKIEIEYYGTSDLERIVKLLEN